MDAVIRRWTAPTRLLDKYGTLAGLMNRPLDEIAQVKGIKVVRAIRLAAAYEICQRLLKEVARDA